MRPLRPATDRSLGRPLPYQLANRPQPPPSAPLPALLPRTYAPGTVCGISSTFAGLSPTEGQVSYVLLTRSPLYLVSQYCYRETVLVRLACVRHAASVDSEPGSNSRLKLSSLRPLAVKNRQPRFEALPLPPLTRGRVLSDPTGRTVSLKFIDVVRSTQLSKNSASRPRQAVPQGTRNLPASKNGPRGIREPPCWRNPQKYVLPSGQLPILRPTHSLVKGPANVRHLLMTSGNSGKFVTTP